MSDEAGTGDWQEIDFERKRKEREDVRHRADEADNYLGDGPADREPDAGESFDDTVPVTAEVAAFYALVPATAPTEWWRDRRLGLGSCAYHSYPAGYPIEKNPCPFQTCSVLIAASPDALYRAAWTEMLSTSPDLPRRQLWKSLIEGFRVERVELTSVRVAWLEDVDEFSGGEPQVRRDARSRRPLPPLSWDRLRDVVAKQFAALAIVGGDPEGLDLAARALVFKVPFQALWEAEAITAITVEDPPVHWLPRLRLGNRLLIVKLISWPPVRSQLRYRAHFRLTMWRANRRKMRRKRRDRRRARRTARRDLMRRELGLDEPDAEKRAKIRSELIGTIRDAIGLLQSLAESVVDLTKALRGLTMVAVALPVGAVVLVLVRLLLL